MCKQAKVFVYRNEESEVLLYAQQSVLNPLCIFVNINRLCLSVSVAGSRSWVFLQPVRAAALAAADPGVRGSAGHSLVLRG